MEVRFAARRNLYKNTQVFAKSDEISWSTSSIHNTASVCCQKNIFVI